MSVLMSAPGPLVVGLGLLVGKSSTQLSDFIRRSAELLAIIAAYVIYRHTEGGADGAKKARLERFANLFVGAVMCLSGAVMLFVALFSGSSEKGNVIPGLVIAVLGVIANCIFWLRYGALSRRTGSAILAVQSRLYRAKTLVDGCVTIALGTVALFPGSAAAWYLDMIGSAIVAIYLVRCGVVTILECRRAPAADPDSSMRLLFEMDRRDYDPAGRPFVRPSVRGILIRDGRVAMVHSRKYDYYKFPGGGMEPGEKTRDTLCREVREEAGLAVIPGSIRAYGRVRRVQKSDRENADYFLQENYYFLCEGEPAPGGQTLDDYEAEEGFTLEFVAPSAAIEVNRTHGHGPKDAAMLERDSRVLEQLMSEGYFSPPAP